MSEHVSNAEELERLRDEVAALTAQRDEIKATNASLAGDAVGLRIACAALKAERDEARREVCLLRAPSTQPSSIASYAIERGWDCFDTPHTNATDVRVQNGGE